MTAYSEASPSSASPPLEVTVDHVPADISIEGSEDPLAVTAGSVDAGTAAEQRALSRAAVVLARLGLAPFLMATDAVSLAAPAIVVHSVVPLAVLVVVMALYSNAGLYRPRLNFSILDQIPALIGRLAVGIALVAGVTSLAGGRVYASLPAAGVAAAMLIASRWAAYSVVRHLRETRVIQHRTLIVGGGQVAGELASVLLEHRELGMLPVGFVDDDPLLRPDECPVPHLAGSADLVSVIKGVDAANVVVAFGSMRESQVVDVVRTCDRHSCEIFYIPRFYELQAIDDRVDMAWSIPLVRLHRAAFRTQAWKVKRAVDVLGATAGLVLLSPVLALCALLVRWESGTPVLFRQHRVGVDGRPFTILKFRTLTPSGDTESQTLWNVSGDARIGRVGRMLRKTSLDELPQLWNVLIGEMSLVGPRPERPVFDSQFAERFPRYVARHRVPAGLTGWAQIHGLRGDTSIQDRARFDNYYIEGWSLWGDCKILLRTIGQVVRAGGG